METYIWVDDADVAAKKVVDAGGAVLAEPLDVMEAGPLDAPWTRIAVLRDPQGATFIASQFVPENAGLGA